MVKQFMRKKSKRVSTKQRVKVDKKVREHKRKLRKEAKKNPKSANKKDPGVPSMLPFKEEVIKEATAIKEKREQEREKKKAEQKKKREDVQNKKRNLSEIMQDAETRQLAYDKKHGLADVESKEVGQSVNKSVENSRKAYYKEFKKVIDAADVVLEVLDARDPIGSRCQEVEEAVRMAAGNKKLVLVLNKIDLVPRANVEAWLKYLRKELPAVAFKASTQQQRDKLTRTKVSISLASKDLLKSSHCLGADVLMKLLANYCRHSEMSISVGIVGFPNTGKSSLINSLKRAKACNVGANPGVTKAMQTVQLDKHIKLLDSPGVVMSTSPTETAAVLRNVVKLESLSDPVPCVEAILSRCQKMQMMLHYKVPNYRDTLEFLKLLALRLGKLKKGGVPDVSRAARMVLHDWNSGKITYYTAPPESEEQSHLVESKIVTEWGKEFNIDDLLKDETEMMQGLSEGSNSHMLVSPLEPLKGVARLEDLEMKNVQQSQAAPQGDGVKEDDDDENEDMEEDDEEAITAAAYEELKGVTVTPSAKEDKELAALAKKAAQPPVDFRHKTARKKPLERYGGLTTKKGKKLAEKKEKKRRKKMDATAGKLSDAFNSAFSSL